MPDYVPPLRDMRFVLENVVDLPGLCRLPDFDHVDPESVMAVLAESGRFLADVIGPLNRVGDTVGSTLDSDGHVVTPPGFRDAYQRYIGAGWGAVPFDQEFGGGGFPWLVAIAIQEMVTSANMAFSLCPLLTQGAIDMLAQHGSAEQQSTYLERMVSGEWTGSMNLTEPDAGSDVGALRTRAVPAGDGSWRITGQKIFITYGEHDMADNIVHLVLARVPDAPPGTRGISCFIVPKYLAKPDGSLGERNDVRCVSIEHKLGIHASPTCVMSYGDNGGAVGYLIGEANQGMRYMFTMMNTARLSVGLEGLAVAERAYQAALLYAQQRRQGRAVGAAPGESSLIVEHPDVRRTLLTMKSFIEAMRCLLYTNAASFDLSRHHRDPEVRQASQELVDLLTPVCKAWCTDLGVAIASHGVQVHGGMGYVEETGVAQHFRDSRIAPIYEGTNGIQAIDLVARKLPMRGGGVVKDLLAQIESLDGDLAEGGDDLAGIRNGLINGVSTLREATDWLIGHGLTEPNDALAGATPYLAIFGLVVGGWLLARSALAAHRLRDTGADRRFLADKIATADFYCRELLPEVAGLLPAVTAGAAPLFGVDLATTTLG
ncbi:MAG: acyl-CoA dehydrogenase [Actinomycetota bacterium]|nr:acyl-CoA dehydrogenase [Actinomycetota bacterium]